MDDPEASLAVLPKLFPAYLEEALRLQAKYADKIHIIIGFEAEFIRPSYAAHVKTLAEAACVDYFIGSVHHVYSIPIDYDKPTYQRAITEFAGGSEEKLWEDYYDLHYQMLTELQPKVVGHFDLIRLMSDSPGRDPREWKGVWDKVLRNLKLVKEQGGWLECNSAALRKGLEEPYPCRAIAEEWLKMGGKFTLSDDSHGIAQVATNYEGALNYLRSMDVKQVWTWKRRTHPGVLEGKKVELEDVAISI